MNLSKMVSWNAMMLWINHNDLLLIWNEDIKICKGVKHTMESASIWLLLGSNKSSLILTLMPKRNFWGLMTMISCEKAIFWAWFNPNTTMSYKKRNGPDFCPHRFRIDGPSLMGHKEVCTGFGRRCFDISTQKKKSFVFFYLVSFIRSRQFKTHWPIQNVLTSLYICL